MLTWQGRGGVRLEAARVLLGQRGMRARGSLVVAGSAHLPAYTASYALVVGEDGVVRRLSVSSASAERERQVSLSRTEDGYWMLDTGEGGHRAEFDGALDADVQTSPLFNALPVRRLELHREAGEHALPVVYVTLPDVTVRLVVQHYRTIALREDGAVVNFSMDSISADVLVDADGLPIDYPGLALRL